jgi:hypothetical protein
MLCGPKQALRTHIHLEALLILLYSLAKENMHKSRIIISVKPKIMINSKDVYFGITR